MCLIICDVYRMKVDCKESVQDMLDEFTNCNENSSGFFVDLEGEDLLVTIQLASIINH